MQENYCLPNNYQCNPAVTFDQNETQYWDPKRVDTSLAYQASFYQWALMTVREHELKSLADFGCGTAAKLARLHAQEPNLATCGFDQPNAIALCKAQYNFGDWMDLDLDHPPKLSTKPFDLVLSSDVIEHLDNPDNLLDAMRAHTHEQSLVMLSTPERTLLRGKDCRTSPNQYHVREWSKDEFCTYLRSRDFEIFEHRLLPAFNPSHNTYFVRRALKRWLKLKTVRYNQGVLGRFRSSNS